LVLAGPWFSVLAADGGFADVGRCGYRFKP
jgi:hypothetical protein